MAANVPQTMKALIKKAGVESYVYESIAVPQPERDDVLIKVDCVATCGSYINLYKWNEVAQVIATIPFVHGHECAGTVVKCGPLAEIPLGSKVGVENHYYCGTCHQCRYDDRAICRNMAPEEIALLEDLGVAHNTVEKLEVKGEDVLVTGCGPVGLPAIAVCKAMGAKILFVDDSTDGLGIGRDCEYSGATPIVNVSFSLFRKGGRTVMVGLPKQPLHVENVLQDIVFKALTLKTVHGWLISQTWEVTEKLVAEKTIDVNRIVSHRFEDAFAALCSGKACTVLIDPSC